jgi:hypothetical protein
VDDPVALDLARLVGRHPLGDGRDEAARLAEPARTGAQVVEDQRLAAPADDPERGLGGAWRAAGPGRVGGGHGSLLDAIAGGRACRSHVR